jgi:hypothetical protein
MKACANDPEFLAFLRAQFDAREGPLQDALMSRKGAGKKLHDWIADQYKAHYFKNSDAVARPIPLQTVKKLKKFMKLRGGAVHFVNARRFEAMGDPRNYMAFYCAAKIGFGDRPPALRFNYDDTSLFVCADSRCGSNASLGQAFTTEGALKLMKKLHRSLGV